MYINRVTKSQGDLGLKIMKKPQQGFFSQLKNGFPQKGLPYDINQWRYDNLPYLLRGTPKIAIARLLKIPHFHGSLYLKPIYANGEYLDLGLVGLKVVTTVGAGYVVDAWQNSVELEDMKYHGLGTGSTAEAVGDTALGTELTTEYSTDNTRATGTTAEGASANIFSTVATNTFDASVLLREHGLLSQAATGGGVLFDRTVFALISLDSGDSLQSTYQWTMATGG